MVRVPGWQAMAPVELDSEAMVAELGGDLGLPLSHPGGAPPDLPAAAPFSGAAPDLLHALRRCRAEPRTSPHGRGW